MTIIEAIDDTAKELRKMYEMRDRQTDTCILG
jgi:hypothetical protein